MSPHRTIRVPAAHAAGVLEALVTIYAVKADALASAAGAYQKAREPLAAILDARRDFAEAEDALDAVDWRLGPRAHDVELVGRAGFVREVLYAALLAAADAAADTCRRYEAGQVDGGVLASAIEHVVAIHDLFDVVEASEAL